MEPLVICLIILTLILSLLLFYMWKCARKAKALNLTFKNEKQVLHDGQQQLNLAFMELRGQRHDMLKHITAIHYLIEQSQYAEAKTYLDHLVSLYDSTNLTIKGEHGHLAAFLFQTKLLAEEHQLELQLDLDAPLSALPLNMTDQSTLVGNLLMNSLDAAIECTKKEARTGKEFIHLFTSIRSGLYVIEISNSTLPLDQQILDSLFQQVGYTTKKGQHEGLGTYIISQVTKKYHGTLDYRYINETFTVKIKIPILLNIEPQMRTLAQ